MTFLLAILLVSLSYASLSHAPVSNSGVFYSYCITHFLHTHTHTHPFNGPFPGLPRWAGTRKVKPIWILLKQEPVVDDVVSNIDVCLVDVLFTCPSPAC